MDRDVRGLCSTSRVRVWLALLAAAGAGTGCSERVDAARVRQWQGSPDGVDRLVAAIKRTDVDANVRAQAAQALVAGGHEDRLQWAVSDLTLEERDRLVPMIVAGLVPTLTRAPGGDDPDVRHAREALHLLRAQSTTPGARAAVEAALFPSLLACLKTNCAGGHRFDAAQMLTEIGAPAVPTVLAALHDAPAPFATAVDVLSKIGDALAKEKGGAALVERAKTSPEIPAALWDALARLGGKPARDFILSRVQAGGPDAAQASATLVKFPRDPELLTPALQIAGDRGAAPAVRADMMQVARRVASPEARKGLLALVAKEPDVELRWKLVEAALPLSQGEAMLELLEALPTAASYPAAELRRRLVDPIGKLGWEPRAGLFKAMESPTSSALAKLVAIWTLEASGWKSDAEHVAKLTKHRGAVRGVPGVTVGSEAARIAEKLQKTGS